MRKSLALAALAGVWMGVYWFAIRPGKLRWGATAEEANRPLPGDNLVPAPTFYATRAITIAGRPEDIWPWIVQIGYGRAGFYGYDLIENPGSPRGISSAQGIVPELQRLAVGDRVYMSPLAYLVVQSMVPNQFLIWAGDEKPPGGAFTWGLFPLDEHHTRLIFRIRFRHHWTDRRLLLDLFTEFTDHVAVPKVLLGIKDRVEGRRTEPLAAEAAEIAVWVAAFLEFAAALILVLVGRRWRRAWMVALLAGFSLQFVLYARAPSWIGAVLDVSILVGAVWAWKTGRSLPGGVPR